MAISNLSIVCYMTSVRAQIFFTRSCWHSNWFNRATGVKNWDYPEMMGCSIEYVTVYPCNNWILLCFHTISRKHLKGFLLLNFWFCSENKLSMLWTGWDMKEYELYSMIYVYVALVVRCKCSFTSFGGVLLNIHYFPLIVSRTYAVDAPQDSKKIRFSLEQNSISDQNYSGIRCMQRYKIKDQKAKRIVRS